MLEFQFVPAPSLSYLALWLAILIPADPDCPGILAVKRGCGELASIPTSVKSTWNHCWTLLAVKRGCDELASIPTSVKSTWNHCQTLLAVKRGCDELASIPTSVKSTWNHCQTCAVAFFRHRTWPQWRMVGYSTAALSATNNHMSIHPSRWSYLKSTQPRWHVYFN